MRQALIIRHSEVESLARNYTAVLEARGFHLEALDPFESAPGYDRFSAPELDDVSLVLVLGGPLSANDGYVALRNELAYLGEALAQAKPVFGVCLGAQLMAVALGATVEPTGGYQVGLRKLSVTPGGSADPVFSKIVIPLVPTLHGECFSLPAEAALLAEGFVLRRDGRYRRINMAFRYRNSYGFQFEPQLTPEELQVWNREMASDYGLMGQDFNPAEEAARNLREFTVFAPYHEAQMRELLMAFLENAGLT